MRARVYENEKRLDESLEDAAEQVNDDQKLDEIEGADKVGEGADVDADEDDDDD